MSNIEQWKSRTLICTLALITVFINGSQTFKQYRLAHATPVFRANPIAQTTEPMPASVPKQPTAVYSPPPYASSVEIQPAAVPQNNPEPEYVLPVMTTRIEKLPAAPGQNAKPENTLERERIEQKIHADEAVVSTKDISHPTNSVGKKTWQHAAAKPHSHFVVHFFHTITSPVRFILAPFHNPFSHRSAKNVNYNRPNSGNSSQSAGGKNVQPPAKANTAYYPTTNKK
jgi:hypothetical protein